MQTVDGRDDEVSAVSAILYEQILGSSFPELPRDEYDREARMLVGEIHSHATTGGVTVQNISIMLASIFSESFGAKFEAYEFEDVARVIEVALRNAR